MARLQEDREDLLRDARNLSPRIQLRVQLASRDAALFAGFRGESLSLYFGPEPAFHFNAHGELRRAYSGGRLIKAVDGRLISMLRVETAQQIELQSMPMTAAEQEAFLADLAARLCHLRGALAADRFEVEGRVPADGDAFARLVTWLDHVGSPVAAVAPNVD